jgi:hypothetical protein
MAASGMPAIVAIEVTAMSPSYGTIVMTIAWIGITQVETIAEVEVRAYVEVRVCIIIPRPPRVIVIVPGDHFGLVVGCIGLNFNVLYINALLTFRYYVEFHHSIALVVIC